MQPHDIVELFISGASLVVSLVALVIANRIAVVNVSAPMILEELYRMAEYLDSRKLNPDPVKDMDRFLAEIELVRKKDFILKKTGFGPDLESIEASVRHLVKTRTVAEQEQQTGTLSPEAGQAYLHAIATTDEKLQTLLRSIRTKLDRVYEDPFEKYD